MAVGQKRFRDKNMITGGTKRGRRGLYDGLG